MAFELQSALMGGGVAWLVQWIGFDKFWYRKNMGDKPATATGLMDVNLSSDLDKLKAELAALKAKHEALSVEHGACAAIKSKYDALVAEMDALKAAPLAQPVMAAMSTPAVDDGHRDPLIDINGIGKRFEEKLFAAGVYTFAQLSAMAPEKIRDIIQPENWQKIEPEKWIEEAKSFASGAKLL